MVTNEKADGISEQEPTLSEINKSELERPLEKNADSIIASTNEDERSDTTFNTLDSSVRRDTVALNKLALQKPKQNKWAFVVTGNGGLSGEGRISVFNGMKSLDSGPYYSAPNNSQNPGPNAPVLYV